MSLFGNAESIRTLPQTLQEGLTRSLVDGTDWCWEKRVGGRNYSLTRYKDFQDGYERDNRELRVSISPYKAFGGDYFQAVRLITNPETPGSICYLERRVDLFDGQFYWISINLYHARGVEEGNPGLEYLFDEVLEPYLGFMQLPAGYAQRKMA